MREGPCSGATRLKRKLSVFRPESADDGGDRRDAAESDNAEGSGAQRLLGMMDGAHLPEENVFDGRHGKLDDEGCLMLCEPVVIALILAWFVLSAMFFVTTHRSLEKSGEHDVGAFLAQTAVHLGTMGALAFLNVGLLRATGSDKHKSLEAVFGSHSFVTWLVLGVIHLVGHAMLLQALSLDDLSVTMCIKVLEPVLVMVANQRRSLPLLPRIFQAAFLFIMVVGGLMGTSRGAEAFGSGAFQAFLSMGMLLWRSMFLQGSVGHIHPHACYFGFAITSFSGFIVALLVLVVMKIFHAPTPVNSTNLETGFYFFGFNAVSHLLAGLIKRSTHEYLKMIKRMVLIYAGVVLLYERFSLYRWLGVALIFIGYTAVTKGRKRPALFMSIVSMILVVALLGRDALVSRELPRIDVRSTPVIPGLTKHGPEEALPFCSVYENKLLSVWAYPERPPSHIYRRCPSEVVYCAYSSCEEHFAGARRIHLKELVRDTPYEEFVRDHMYYKVLEKEDFVEHVQSVAMIALLLKGDGICVRIAGQTAWHCQSDRNWPSIEYDPRIPGTMPHFRLAKMLRSEESFLLLSNSQAAKNQVVRKGAENEMNSLAALQFMPYLTDMIDRDSGLTYASGFILLNGFMSATMAWPPGEEAKPIFLSTKFGEDFQKLLKSENFWYFRNYWGRTLPIGSFDDQSFEFFNANGISSFRSSSLSLLLSLREFPIDASEEDLWANNTERSVFMIDVPAQAQAELAEEVLDAEDVIATSSVPPLALIKDDIGMFGFAYNLARRIAEEAQIVVTGKKVVAFIAMAQKVPVVYIPPAEKSEGKTQKVTHHRSLFHTLESARSTPMFWIRTPRNPGNHVVDRYRAAMWDHLVSQSRWFLDAAELFGSMPLVRLGRGQPLSPTTGKTHNLFHMVLSGVQELTPTVIRRVESVFYFHPNARLTIYSNDFRMARTELSRFAETGYNVQISSFDLVQSLRQLHIERDLVKRYAKHTRSLPGDISLLPIFVLFMHGGVFVGDVILNAPLPLSLDSNQFCGDSLLAFSKGNPILKKIARAKIKELSKELSDVIIKLATSLGNETFPAIVDQTLFAKDDAEAVCIFCNRYH